MAKGKVSLTIEVIMKDSLSPVVLSFYTRKKIMNKCSEMIFYYDQEGNYCELPQLQQDCDAIKIAKGIQKIPGVINTEEYPIYISDCIIYFAIQEWCDPVDAESEALAIIAEVFCKSLHVKRKFEEE